MRPGLSEFQVLTELQLLERLQTAGLTLDQRQVKGEAEPFVEGVVDDVRIWIYHDEEACIIGRGLDRVFEKWDYESPDALRAAFLDRLMELFGER